MAKKPGPVKGSGEHDHRYQFWISRVMLKAIDQARGKASRAAWIREAVQDKLENKMVERMLIKLSK